MMLPASSSSGSGLADTMLSASSPNGSGLADTLLPASSLSGSGLADVLWPASSSLGSSLTGREFQLKLYRAPPSSKPRSSSFVLRIGLSVARFSRILVIPVTLQLFPVTSLGSGLVDWKLSATLTSTPCASSASRAIPVPSLDFFAPQGIADMLSDSALTLLVLLLTGPAPPVHPNTTCKLPIFNHSDTPTTVGFLKLEHWAPFLDLYPDQDFANQLRGALRHGACQGSRA
ncbi:uncharacterized protein UHO2_01265 [Ustilago hordei]|uniref:uncharacterized protein n=1 Tax=Ustilago hordei TaxID=120017 RepID=UPI001A62761A|nr:uncharacterized protein UHO2_01265 [Ustilago hordei]SYW74400.1 uncharacterized protein UHO2_01265 [Ustilago hordei]